VQLPLFLNYENMFIIATKAIDGDLNAIVMFIYSQNHKVIMSVSRSLESV
jgi:hypothetical protein